MPCHTIRDLHVGIAISLCILIFLQGYFSISLGIPEDPSFFKEVARVPDGGEPSLHIYTAEIMLPSATVHHNYILQVSSIPGDERYSPASQQVIYTHVCLQVSYTTKNPQAPPMFYQCADMMLL